jgi:hypothetical protein
MSQRAATIGSPGQDRLTRGNARFTLAGIAGVINPASRNRRSFRIDGRLGEGAEILPKAVHGYIEPCTRLCTFFTATPPTKPALRNR